MFQICMKVWRLLIENLEPEETTQGDDVVSPLYKALNIIMPVALGIILLAGTIYAVAIGVQYSRAENADERNKAKKKLVNGIIGFGIVLVLTAILYAIRGSVVDLINGGKGN